MERSNGLKIGDFVKHKKSPAIIFQIVQILDSVNAGEPAMLNCVLVRDIHSHREDEVEKYELDDDDRDRIINNDCR
jgi:hypothetical protein